MAPQLELEKTVRFSSHHREKFTPMKGTTPLKHFTPMKTFTPLMSNAERDSSPYQMWQQKHGNAAKTQVKPEVKFKDNGEVPMKSSN